MSDANLRKHLSGSSHQVPNVLFTSQMKRDSKQKGSNISRERKLELHTAAINCILRDGLPFGVFRRPGMTQLLQTAVPGYIGPDRRTVRRKIAVLYSWYTTKLRSVLRKVESLALTCDLWRSSQRTYYLSLTAHFFTEDFENMSIVLSCRRVIGRHVASTVERYIKFELDRLHIRPEQIVTITTDNGSDVKKATSSFMFGDRVSCMAHNLNLVVKNGLCLWTEPNPNE